MLASRLPDSLLSGWVCSAPCALVWWPPVTSGWQLPPIALLDVSRRVLSLDAGGPVAG